MDYRKLEVLLATIHMGSFSKAADKLYCTQSAVTQIMNNIEAELGFKVLERSHKGIKLSKQGEQILPYIIEAEQALKKLSDKSKEIEEGKNAPIRIGSFSSIANTLLPQIIKNYQSKYPEVMFDIKIGTDVISQWMLNNEIDIAFGDSERCKAFRWFPLFDDPYMAIMPSSYVTDNDACITQAEFAKYPLLMAPMNVLDRHLQTFSNKQLNVSCDDDYTLLSMVSEGLGVTAMPKLSIRNIPDNITVLDLIPSPKRIIGIAVLNSPTTEIKSFLEFVKKNVFNV